jgi:spore germination cell wall hydrolase CwlJ-like protein
VRAFPDEAIAATTIANEAGNQPDAGMLAVAETIRNRTERRYASDGTVAETVLRKKQFSCWNHTTPWRHRLLTIDTLSPVYVSALAAWRKAIIEKTDTVKGAVLYHTVRRPEGETVWPPSWASAETVKHVATIADHMFYTDEPK